MTATSALARWSRTCLACWADRSISSVRQATHSQASNARVASASSSSHLVSGARNTTMFLSIRCALPRGVEHAPGEDQRGRVGGAARVRVRRVQDDQPGVLGGGHVRGAVRGHVYPGEPGPGPPRSGPLARCVGFRAAACGPPLCTSVARVGACHAVRRVWAGKRSVVVDIHLVTRRRGSVRGRGEVAQVGDRSAIEWTEATWNPTTGCDRVSAGCDNCYALALAKRLKAMGSVKYQADGDPRTSGPGFGVTVHPDALTVPYRWRAPRRVFVNSMSDLFHARVPLDFVRRVFDVMADTPQHTYQILTKRSHRLRLLADQLYWPGNVWMGVSVEDSSALDRIDDLRSVPAAVRFLSCEPLIGPLHGMELGGINWVIVGGESGRVRRPIDPAWVREIRDACLRESVPFFFKQWGGVTPKACGRTLDGRTWDEMPRLVDDAQVSAAGRR